MASINLCFRIHQPYQFNRYCFNDIGKTHSYEDTAVMLDTMNRLADNCYLPANKILLNEIRKAGGKFKVAFSISGTTLELFGQFRPDLIDSFKQLVQTGCVEILGETHYNSLSWLHSKTEFNRQEMSAIPPYGLCNTCLIVSPGGMVSVKFIPVHNVPKPLVTIKL